MGSPPRLRGFLLLYDEFYYPLPFCRRLSLRLLVSMVVGWLMPGLYQEVSAVDTKLTPFALSRSRHSMVSSRDHEKFLSL